MNNELELQAIPALTDNYIWAAAGGAIIVDPGEAGPVLRHLESGPDLRAVFLTHKHADHIDGLDEILARHPAAKVYAPRTEGNDRADFKVGGGDSFEVDGVPGVSFRVYDTPGHTSGHITYAGGDALFCGDALFSCGCGRLFEGDAHDLAATMELFVSLPGELRICCGHEYTLSNIRFARSVDPDNADLLAWESQAQDLRDAGKPTLPVTLAHDRRINPFLRYEAAELVEAASRHAGAQLHEPHQILGELRAMKDAF